MASAATILPTAPSSTPNVGMTSEKDAQIAELQAEIGKRKGAM